MSGMIRIVDLSKSFVDARIFDRLSINIKRGEVTAIMGPNGSGKSTLLAMAAGLLAPDAGRLEMDGFKCSNMSVMLQDFRRSLFPWRTNLKNLVFPLEARRMSNQEINARLQWLLRMYTPPFRMDGYPYQLSGGQQQILAFLRAIISRPMLLLADEPFSAIDIENRKRLYALIDCWLTRDHPTVVFITHDTSEAVRLSDRVVIFSRKPVQAAKIIENTFRNGSPVPSARAWQQIETAIAEALA